jgi:hypothetical protein
MTVSIRKRLHYQSRILEQLNRALSSFQEIEEDTCRYHLRDGGVIGFLFVSQ